MWSWSKLSAVQWEDAWSERIAGNPRAVIESLKGGKTIRITVYCETEDDAKTLKDYFGGRVREIKTEDWMVTQSQYCCHELKIRDRLIIAGTVDDEQLNEVRGRYPGRVVLAIPAEMAFGTGDHATTSTCLRMLHDFARAHRQETWTMTDIGCGTAVLALAASALGAAHATAFDFDPQAIEVAQRNIQRNAGLLHGEIDLFQADVFEWIPTPDQTGDLVVANLFSTILQKAFPSIIRAMKPGASLIVSGILRTQWEETQIAGEQYGLRFDHVVTRGKWTTARGYMK